ncbi:hypothetical protein A9Q89_06490 [Gammaproteobacteria bacterium 53_120_T64]|nr:hypothetical protein A9Q89_06490 [Gammaproteobacteria bacterium 53_120_T64]
MINMINKITKNPIVYWFASVNVMVVIHRVSMINDEEYVFFLVDLKSIKNFSIWLMPLFSQAEVIMDLKNGYLYRNPQKEMRGK